jgi:transaldolase
LLFSPEQYLAAAEAYLRGVERRIEAGLNPRVESVASVFIGRWDVAVANHVPATLANRLGIAVAQHTYQTYRDFLGSARCQRAANFGARPQRLLWASTGTKDPTASDILYVKALAAPFTIITIPDRTLEAFADHGDVTTSVLTGRGDWEAVLTEFHEAEIDVNGLATQLQEEGAATFVKSWDELMACIESKMSAVQAA